MPVQTATEIDAAPFAHSLDAWGDRTALVTADQELSYRELARRVDELGERLGPVRRLVLLAAANDVETVVGYLAALLHGHPVILVSRQRDAVETMAEVYSPDVTLNGLELTEHHPTTAHALHPELALLLSTSGSSGSPKLVRLSHANLQSNAEAIAAYLGIRSDDRAATTLPLHYCYGLSVLNSHLARGAAVLLTQQSVAERDFWEFFRRERGATFAAVPYTFDLLERNGFADLELPHLRYITQAGGRLDPQRVRHYAQLGEARGWDLVVMYGQTEATARMAYLPAELATTAPDAIGVAIPGGAFRIAEQRNDAGADTDEDGVGELVYSGPNVMMGYATRPADLSLGRVSDELFTGDLAKLGEDGLYRIVGRRSRVLKLFGLRIELERVESLLADQGVTAFCAGDDRTLVVAIPAPLTADPAVVRRHLVDATGLPAAAIRIELCAQIPRLASGKPDYPAIAALARVDSDADQGEAVRSATPARPSPGRRPSLGAEGPPADPVQQVVRIYAVTLERTDVTPAHSFVDLGGDSLSYVETSIRLEQAIGGLPPDWHVTPIADLVAPGPASPPAPASADEPRPRRLRMLDTSVLLRALAIVFIVGTHVELFGILGGAHMLLGVAGYNFARFQLTGAGRADRARSIARSVGRIVAATVAVVVVVMILSDQYSWANLLLLNNVVGTVEHLNTWHFWYIEDLVYFIAIATLLLSLRPIDRWERRWPFALPMALMALGLVARYQLIPGVELHKTAATAWLFLIGWAAARATGPGQRALLTVATVATIPGVFGNPAREAVMVAGLVVLIWVPTVPVTRRIAAVAGTLASASLYIYLVHWQVYPHIWHFSKPLAFVASLAAGLLYAALFRRVTRLARSARGRVTARRVLAEDTGGAAIEGRLDRRSEGALN